MLKRTIALLVVALVLSPAFSGGAAYADSRADKDARLAEKVKAGISKLGAGGGSLVEVKLRDRTSLAGFVSDVGDDAFVVSSTKTGRATTVAYRDVTKVKGHNLTRGSKIAIIAGAVAAGVILFIRWATQFE